MRREKELYKMARYEVEKLEYGNEGQLKFSNKTEYYEVVGLLCNEDIFLITYEENSKTRSYTDAYRIKCRIDKEKLVKPLRDAIRSGNRINCNEFVEQLKDKQGFIQEYGSKKIRGYYDKVIQTIPDQYVDDFNKGYFLYKSNQKTDFKKGAVFENRTFREYKIDNIESARDDVTTKKNVDGTDIINVFVSHKHEDLEVLGEVIGFLEQKYGVKVYIDSRDSSMPGITSGETAIRIKNRIDSCDKFVLLATDKAIESKWCNWELGYGDAKKYEGRDIALLSMRDTTGDYKGNEYLEIYPHIIPAKELDVEDLQGVTEADYYVRIPKNDKTFTVISLDDWFKYSFVKKEE